LVAYGCAKGVSGPSAFRIAWGVQGIPAFILLGSLFFFPESPRWLGSEGRWQEVENTLALLHAKGNLDDPGVQAELLEIREAVATAQNTEGVSFFGLFGKKMWRRTLCGTTVQMWQQLLGGNVAMYCKFRPFTEEFASVLTSPRHRLRLPDGRTWRPDSHFIDYSIVSSLVPFRPLCSLTLPRY